MRTLLLNADYRPLQAISWQKAIGLWFDDKVEIIEEYGDVDINSVNFSMKCPAVIRLIAYKKIRNKTKNAKFSRYNVFYRDNFQCQYCQVQFLDNNKKLTFDHVVPKAKGGKTEWTNILTACHACNTKKSDKLLSEAGMTPLKTPTIPKLSDITIHSSINEKRNEIWKSYIY